MHAAVAFVMIAAFCAPGADVSARTYGPWRWVPIGGGGAIMTVEVNPHRHNVLLAGCDVGGVLRSDDYGHRWRICNTGLASDGDRAVADFLWDSVQPDVVWMASGACFGQPDGPYGGLWRSDDEGRSWRLVSRKVRFSGFGSYRQWGGILRFDPRDGSLLAGTAWDGLMRSRDCGRTWESLGLSGKFIVGVELAPAAPDTIYVAVLPTEYCKGAVWVTRDGGRTWDETLGGEKVRSIAADPRQAGRAYVVVRDKGVLVTEDFGRTWRLSVSGLEQFLQRQWGSAIVVNPLRNDTICFCASERFGAVKQWWRWRHPGLFASGDGGASWGPIISASMAGGRFDYDAYLDHVNCGDWWKGRGWFGFGPMGWAVDPVDGRRLYMHDLYGVWASDDGGENWRAAMDGLATTGVGAVVCNPARRDEVYLGLLDVAFFRTRDAGRTIEHWDSAYPASNCTNLAVETRGGQEVIYSVAGGRLVLSKDRGRTWQNAPGTPPEGAKLGPVTLDCFRPHCIYCGRFMSPDGGRTWDEIPGLPDGWGGRIVGDPTTPDRLYAWDERQVLVSADAGKTWRDVSGGLPLVYAGKRRLEALVVMPRSGRAFAGSAAHGLFASDDQGATWQCVLPKRYISAVDCGADGTTVVAAAWQPWYSPECEPGIFLSRDAGESWERIGEGLSGIARPQCIALDPVVARRIWIGTSGNGAFVREF